MSKNESVPKIDVGENQDPTEEFKTPRESSRSSADFLSPIETGRLSISSLPSVSSFMELPVVDKKRPSEFESGIQLKKKKYNSSPFMCGLVVNQISTPDCSPIVGSETSFDEFRKHFEVDLNSTVAESDMPSFETTSYDDSKSFLNKGVDEILEEELPKSQ